MRLGATGAAVVLHLLFVTASCTYYSRRAAETCRSIDKYKCVERDSVECGGEQCTAPSVCRVKKRECNGGGGQSGGCSPVCGQVGTPCGDPAAGLLCKFNEACVDANGCIPFGSDPNCTPSHICQKKDDWDIDPAFVDFQCTSFHTINSADTCATLLEKWGMHPSRFFKLNVGFNCAQLTPGQQACVAGHVLYKEPQCGGVDSHCEAGFECVPNTDCEFNTGDQVESECVEELHEVCEPPPAGEQELCGDTVCGDGYVCEKSSALSCGRQHKDRRKAKHFRRPRFGSSNRRVTFSPTRGVTKFVRFGG